MGEVCPTCGATQQTKPRPKYDTLAEQQAAWLAKRLAEKTDG